MVLFKKLHKILHRIENPTICLSLDRRILNRTGYWPKHSLKNVKFIGSLVLSITCVLLTKINYLRIVAQAANIKQNVVVIPEIFVLCGFYYVSILLFVTGKTLKMYLEEFEVEWEMSKCDKFTYIVE